MVTVLAASLNASQTPPPGRCPLLFKSPEFHSCWVSSAELNSLPSSQVDGLRGGVSFFFSSLLFLSLLPLPVFTFRFGRTFSISIPSVRMSPSPRFFTEREVARHCTKDSCWVLLGTRVYDVTAFLRMHPGGEALILRRSGKDISREIEGPPHRHSENARRWMEQYYIGELDKTSGSDEAQVRDRPTLNNNRCNSQNPPPVPKHLI